MNSIRACFRVLAATMLASGFAAAAPAAAHDHALSPAPANFLPDRQFHVTVVNSFNGPMTIVSMAEISPFKDFPTGRTFFLAHPFWAHGLKRHDFHFDCTKSPPRHSGVMRFVSWTGVEQPVGPLSPFVGEMRMFEYEALNEIIRPIACSPQSGLVSRNEAFAALLAGAKGGRAAFAATGDIRIGELVLGESAFPGAPKRANRKDAEGYEASLQHVDGKGQEFQYSVSLANMDEVFSLEPDTAKRFLGVLASTLGLDGESAVRSSFAVQYFDLGGIEDKKPPGGERRLIMARFMMCPKREGEILHTVTATWRNDEEYLRAVRFIDSARPRCADEDTAIQRHGSGAALGNQLTPQPAQPTPPGRQAGASVFKVPIDDSPVKGSEDALVTLVEFFDYQSPFCARAHTTVEKLREEYGNKLRVVMKQNPLSFHPRAKPAAVAAMAAGEQGKYWEYHDKLFANAKALDDADLEKYASELKLDMARWKKDLTNPKFQQIIERDQALAGQLGATSTPAFFINGRPLLGAQPFENFKAAIDEELKKGSGSFIDNQTR